MRREWWAMGKGEAGQPRRRFSRLAFFLFTTAFFGWVLVPEPLRAAGELRVTFLDVGQGDAALIQDPNGFDVLIDGGEPFAGPVVAAFLRAHQVDDVDVMVVSHPHQDHIGGLIDVLEMEDIPVVEVVYNGYPGTTQTWTEFVNAVAAEKAVFSVVRFPAELSWGDLDVLVLNPPSGLVDPDANDASLVLRILYGDVSLLFTGDIESPAETQVLARGTPVAADILKVAHHGSDTSSSSAFLAAVSPADSVISVGVDNPYGHPDQATLDRLAQVGTNVWRTDLHGNVTVTGQGSGYILTVEKGQYRVYLAVIQR